MSESNGNGSAREDGAAGPGTGSGPRCPLCGAAVFRRHCKYVCPQHGVVVDCSDPFAFD